MDTLQHFRQQQYQGQQSCGWLCPGWLSVVVCLAWSVIAAASLWLPVFAQSRASAAEGVDTRQAREPIETVDPRAILARAQAWQARGEPFPDAMLRQAVEMALQPEASWEQITAAITAFDVYKDRAWVTQVLQPFVAYHAAHIVLNAEVFARLHRGWTQQAIALAAPQAPGLVLGALRTLTTLDPAWARQLATTVATTAPAVVWPHVDVLLAVDVHWAEGLVREAALAAPYDAIRAVSAYRTAPWGPQFFADVVLREPRWVVSLVTSDPERHTAVRRALDEAMHPALQILAQLIDSRYPEEIKGRTAVFAEAIAAHALSLEAATQRSSAAHTYVQTLVAMQLRDPDEQHRAIGRALGEEVSMLVEEINSLFEQPAAVRFRAVETLTARELYVLLVYGEAEMFTSSYRGVFDRLLARMRQEGLTGDQLLTVVHQLRFRVFIKSAAVLNRLTLFLATIPSPVARWSLLRRCMSDIERASDVLLQAVTAAELLAAPLDGASLRVIWETLRSEFAGAELVHNRHARIIYGLLIAVLAQRHASALQDPALRTIAEQYLPFFPERTEMPMARLFPTGVSVQRYFFYNDDDGKQSFQSFLAQYHRDPSWQIEDHGAFVHLVSATPARTIEIYANTFTADEQGSNAIDEVLRQRRVTPSVIVHRGHSIYVDRTLEKLPATAALVYLGNCGGYTLLDTLVRKAPEAHIITTKGIGSITINDPLLKALNDYLLSGQDMTWSAFWQQAQATLGRNPRFVDYVPPDKHAGAVFLQAYRRVMAASQAFAQVQRRP